MTPDSADSLDPVTERVARADDNDLASYAFDLPHDRIAQHAVEPRRSARLLGLERATGSLRHGTVADLPTWLPRGTLLVANDTKVVPARLLGRKDSGGQVELLLTRPFGVGGGGLLGHAVLARSSKPLRAGQRIALQPGPGATGPEQSMDSMATMQVTNSAQVTGATGMTASVVAVGSDGTATVDLAGAADLHSLLAHCGHVPLPPYIRHGRETPGLDRARYQCMFATQPGAIAAPTAGLHLDAVVLAGLAAAGIEFATVTLHVGPGTFLPVRQPDLRRHAVLPERFEVSEATAAALEKARRDGRPIAAVGTTTVRTLETLALRCDINAGGPVRALAGEADLTIRPGHRFGLVGGMLTNFHLPQSSLLVLVCAFGGRERVLAAYGEAVRARYRFYSYGDAMWVS
ncbi:MAG: tRNA preQ1(34) S-adenosylmethionine ribosyltransferase-isomerase QueA [Myxococcales bacterium]|nr:tRNA preQ1(34) S-adenosylmethionine ribosyltransferase-isomerase QueA [Myxococcales bacterium]